MLTFKCPACRKEIVGDDRIAGQEGECPFCGKVVTAPARSKADGDGGARRDAPRCPKCGARRKGSESKCGFCGAALEGSPKTRVAPKGEPEGLDRRKVLLLGGIVVAGLIVVGVMTMGGEEAPAFPPDDLCRRQMMAMLTNAWTCPGGTPQSSGTQFWVDVAQRCNVPGALKCPAEVVQGRRCDYRGPAKPFAELTENEIVMTCMKGNHPGGVNILFKSGAVEWAAEGTPLATRAISETKE